MSENLNNNEQEDVSVSKKDVQQLLHVFSHDLRNPLVNMEALLRDSEQYCTGDVVVPEHVYEMRDNMLMMQDVVQRMNQMIHGAQEIYHAMFDALHCEYIDLAALVDLEVARCRRDYALSDTVSISVQLDVVVWGDALVLRRMIAELLDNAVLAMQGKQEGCISIEQKKQRGMHVLLVRDCGVGLSESDMQYVFQPFFSLSQRRGLGLAKVKAWAQAHGGKVWCESKEHMGTIVYIALPEKG